MKPIKPDGALPLLPLRDMVVFPRSVVKVYVGRASSVAAVNAAIEKDGLVLVCTQKKADVNKPDRKDLYAEGTIGKVIRMQGLPDGTVRLVLQGTERFSLLTVEKGEHHMSGSYKLVDMPPSDPEHIQALYKLLLVRAREFAQSSQQKDSLLENINSLSAEQHNFFDFVANMLPISLEEKFQILCRKDEQDMVAALIAHIDSHLELLQIDDKVQQRVRDQISRNQREYYLNEQMKAVQREMMEVDDNKSDPIENMLDKIKAAKMTSDAETKAKEELNKLRSMSPMSSEAAVIRNFLDVLIGVPWSKRTKANYDLTRARKVLDQDHFGLGDVKERILEFIATTKRSKGNLKAPILCLVGPPGVGKTSLGKSIAQAIDRKFIRMSLGGVRDESEIRGHRRTYIGAMPGRIVQKLSKVKVVNPVFLLDEIDKMGMDFRGDPASALLEVLDPEQNNRFNDHYLEVDYDLSKVLFICTSNSMNIPEALLDRLEIIRIAGYTESEKRHIATNHLIPKLLKDHSCTQAQVDIQQDAVESVIHTYTREAGVRGLERELAKAMRKSVLILEEQKEPKNIVVDAKNLHDFLGPEKFSDSQRHKQDLIGVVNGLAWTKFGGQMLSIETAVFPGKGEILMTGSMGDVMRESVRAALSVCRVRSIWLKLPENFFAKHDFHVHIPEGATPKDGPSAGITICVALFSLISGLAVRHNMAMTGELTISGNVLPIGGLKEKLLAAQRAGIKTVCIPKQNQKDLVEVPDEVLESVQIETVADIDQVLTKALVDFDAKWLSLPLTPAQLVHSPQGIQAH